MGNISDKSNDAVVYVAWNTGDDKRGRVYLNGTNPIRNNDGVFQTVNAASEELKKYNDKTWIIKLYADGDNPSCDKLLRNFYYMDNNILSNQHPLTITTVDGLYSYFNSEDVCDSIFTTNAFLYIVNDSRGVVGLTVRYLNFANSSVNYVNTDSKSYKANYITFEKGDRLRGKPNLKFNFTPFKIIDEKVPLITFKGTTYMEDFGIILDFKDQDKSPNVLIQNHGLIIGSYPSVRLSNIQKNTNIIENLANASINMDGNNVSANSIIESNKEITLIKTTNPTKDTQINMENCEFDISIADNSILFDNQESNVSDKVFNLVRCNFNQKNNMSLLTNTTNYKLVDGISNNVLIPTCSNMISSFTDNYNIECVKNRPDATSKINGGTITNSTIIIPPKVINTDYIIEDIFLNDASIYLVDTTDGDINITLPSEVLDGLYITFKKMDKSCNKVKIIAPKGFTIEGNRAICLKTIKCNNTTLKLLYHNKVYYIL